MGPINCAPNPYKNSMLNSLLAACNNQEKRRTLNILSICYSTTHLSRQVCGETRGKMPPVKGLVPGVSVFLGPIHLDLGLVQVITSWTRWGVFLGPNISWTSFITSQAGDDHYTY